VPRNYLVQEVIEATERGDREALPELLDVLRRPYDEQPGRQRFAHKRPEGASHRPRCSILSCSALNRCDLARFRESNRMQSGVSIAACLARRPHDTPTEETTMRFMMIVKANKESEAGTMPDEKALAAMGKYNEELAKAGVLLDLAGLTPTSQGAR